MPFLAGLQKAEKERIKVRQPLSEIMVDGKYEAMIGDMTDLQIIAELSNNTFISGHWEVKGEKDWAETIFVPDFLCKELISNDDIIYWDFVRNIV